MVLVKGCSARSLTHQWIGMIVGTTPTGHLCFRPFDWAASDKYRRPYHYVMKPSELEEVNVMLQIDQASRILGGLIDWVITKRAEMRVPADQLAVIHLHKNITYNPPEQFLEAERVLILHDLNNPLGGDGVYRSMTFEHRDSAMVKEALARLYPPPEIKPAAPVWGLPVPMESPVWEVEINVAKKV